MTFNISYSILTSVTNSSRDIYTYLFTYCISLVNICFIVIIVIMYIAISFNYLKNINKLLK